MAGERDGSKADDSFPFEDRDEMWVGCFWRFDSLRKRLAKVFEPIRTGVIDYDSFPFDGRPDNDNTYNTKFNDWPIHCSPGPQDPFCNVTSIGLAIAFDDACANRIVNDHILSTNDWSCAPGNGGSPGPQQWEFIKDLVDMDNLKMLPKRIKDLADTFTKERVGTELLPLLAALEYAPTARGSRTANTGGAAVPFLLDSGASMNAVGDASVMQGIRVFSTDMWVTIPDGSSLRIVGIGTIQMDGFSIPNVYLVDGLRKNLISVSQLDKDHGMCSSFRNGICEITLADGTVVGGAILQDDGMYKLYFLEVPEPEM